VKDAPKLTFAKAKTLIGTRPWGCEIVVATGRANGGKPPDTSTSTEVWMRAISTDVPLPRGFDEDTTTAAYVDVGGQWYRIRQAGIGHNAPLKISSSPTHS
jgi:hypothetical protein